MGGYNRIFVADRMSIAQDEDTVLPSEIYLVIHQQSTCDCNSKTTFETEIVSVYYQFEDAVATASRYVRALFGMDEGDQEWLEMLDWQGEGWYADEGLASQEILHHIHVQAMNIN